MSFISTVNIITTNNPSAGNLRLKVIFCSRCWVVSGQRMCRKFTYEKSIASKSIQTSLLPSPKRSSSVHCYINIHIRDYIVQSVNTGAGRVCWKRFYLLTTLVSSHLLGTSRTHPSACRSAQPRIQPVSPTVDGWVLTDGRYQDHVSIATYLIPTSLLTELAQTSSSW